MGTYRVSFADDLADQFRVLGGAASDHEEGRPYSEPAELLKYRRRELRIRPVIECDGHAAALG